MVYPALLPLMHTPRLPVVDRTDAPADLNGTRPFCRKTKSDFCACAITFQTQSTIICHNKWPSSNNSHDTFAAHLIAARYILFSVYKNYWLYRWVYCYLLWCTAGNSANSNHTKHWFIETGMFSNKVGKGKSHPCTGTEALYRPYGP